MGLREEQRIQTMAGSRGKQNPLVLWNPYAAYPHSETTTDESYKLAPGKLLLRENDEVSGTSELQRLTRHQINHPEPLKNQFFLQG